MGKETIGSQAFDIADYERGVTDLELRDDIVSYLGEYRLNVQEYSYSYQFYGGTVRDLRLRDQHQGEPMRVKAERALEEKRQQGEPSFREEAELLGLERLEQQLAFAPDKSTVIWVSPPGPKSEGYGDYGFVYIGKVHKENPLSAQVAMSAIRVESPTLLQSNTFLNEFISNKPKFYYAENFLESPFVVHADYGKVQIQQILQRNFNFKIDYEKQRIAERVATTLTPAVEELIHLLKNGNSAEKLKAFYAVENYALVLKEKYSKEENKVIDLYSNNRGDPEQLAYLVNEYNYKPKVVAGSCGSTKSDIKSNQLFENGFDALKKMLFGNNENESYCSVCKSENNDTHYHCPKPTCEKKYADETHKSAGNRTKECECGFKFAC